MSNDIESLARGAREALALAHRLALIRVESEHRLAAYYRSRSNLDQAAASATASPPQPAPPNPSPAMPIPAAHPAPPVAQATAAGEHGGASPPTAAERANDRIPDRK